MADNRTTGLHAFKKDFKYNPMQAVMSTTTFKEPMLLETAIDISTQSNVLTN